MPFLTSSTHCASASVGASTTGTPIKRSRRLASSLCLGDTCTVPCTTRRQHYQEAVVVVVGGGGNDNNGARMVGVVVVVVCYQSLSACRHLDSLGHLDLIANCTHTLERATPTTDNPPPPPPPGYPRQPPPASRPLLSSSSVAVLDESAQATATAKRQCLGQLAAFHGGWLAVEHPNGLQS